MNLIALVAWFDESSTIIGIFDSEEKAIQVINEYREQYPDDDYCLEMQSYTLNVAIKNFGDN